MSKYDDTKFYWLQLKEDFFEDDAIAWLEEQQPNGRDYAYFYLKLCLKSLKTNGILIRKVGNVLIPYNNQKLAELTKIDFDTVTVAMKLLQEIGLIKVFESGEIYVTQLENLIGSKSIGALKKQQQRMLKKAEIGQLADKCPPKIEYRDRDKNIDIDNIYIPHQKNEYELEFETLWEMYPNKKGKKDALRHYINVRKNNVSYETIFKGLENYLKYIEISKIDLKYIKHGSSWFNQRGWEDDYSINETHRTKSKSEEQFEFLKGVYDGTIKVK